MPQNNPSLSLDYSCQTNSINLLDSKSEATMIPPLLGFVLIHISMFLYRCLLQEVKPYGYPLFSFNLL